MSRSHKISVPTSRPPAAARKILYLWGRGPLGRDIESYLTRTGVAVERDNEVAHELASTHGCPIDMVQDAWALRVDGADENEIDALTRDDRSVMGWTENAREACTASVALRNALNALTRDEYQVMGETLAKRFAMTGPSPGKTLPNRWTAKDNRIVYYDAERLEWRLGAYAGM